MSSPRFLIVADAFMIAVVNRTAIASAWLLPLAADFADWHLRATFFGAFVCDHGAASINAQSM